MKKEWKQVPNYSRYFASTDGEIKTFSWKGKNKEAIMKPSLDGSGYLRTMLKRDDGKTHTIKVHRIIAQTFIPNKEDKPQVNHKNGIRSDNRVINLEWVTISENQIHSYNFLDRERKFGEKNSQATLTDAQVIEIRANYKYGRKSRHEGGESKPQIAKRYNTTKYVIGKIVTNQTWKHLL
jgi:hypothetical protein